MDANSKLGPDLIPSDPHPRSPNGQVLSDIMSRHGLVVVNGIKDKCEGTTTRRRVTINGVEESAIDFVIVSEDIEPAVLTKVIKTKK